MALLMTVVNFFIIGILVFCWTSVSGPARVVIVALVLSLLGNTYGWHYQCKCQHPTVTRMPFLL